MRTIVVLLLLASINAMAAEYKTLFFEIDDATKTCSLNEFGPKKLLDGYYSTVSSGCSVILDSKQFSEKFEFCALGSIKAISGSLPNCSVNYAETYGVEFSQKGDSFTCRFVCKTKPKVAGAH